MQKKPELRFHVYEVPGAVRLAETESKGWEPGLGRGWAGAGRSAFMQTEPPWGR